jgi:hypothetical protein
MSVLNCSEHLLWKDGFLHRKSNREYSPCVVIGFYLQLSFHGANDHSEVGKIEEHLICVIELF